MKEADGPFIGESKCQSRRKGENGLLYALRLLNYVQDNERDKLVLETKAKEAEMKES